MRTRFAPSPTGYLHVGGLRTALYAYLIAKQTNDKFLLRIEDTDQDRSVPGAIENILTTLHWAGLRSDEGVMLDNEVVIQKGTKGPYIQSERLHLYKPYAEQLIKSGHAYIAFDTPNEIERMRIDLRTEQNPAPRYDASIRMRMRNALTMSADEVTKRVSDGEPYVIRLKVNPEEHVMLDDHVRGQTTFKGHTIDDQVLLKSDGFPTYHLAHVVDDHLMDIGLIIRGEEWLSSTPKHLLLFKALGWQAPEYAHLPLLLNADRSKLSKRQGDVSVSEYINKGYLPEAMLNFLATLGWNSGDAEEIYSLADLIKQFSIDRVQKAGAIFNTKKLDWLQGQWMRRMSPAEFAKRIQSLISKKYPAAAEDKDFKKKAALIQERITFLHEAPDMLGFFYQEPPFDVGLVANKKQKVEKKDVPKTVAALIAALEPIAEKEWTIGKLKIVISAIIEKENLKQGQLLWPLRAILTGKPYSPGAYEVAEALGKEKTLIRLRKAA